MNIVLFDAEELGRPIDAKDPRAVHIKKVLRKTVGDSFEAGLINGPSGTARITAMNERQFAFTFSASAPFLQPPPLELIIGFPRPIQLKRLLRDVSSLGAEVVHLTGTELGEKSYMQSSLVERGAAQAALIDGACQAKRTGVPRMEMYTELCCCLRRITEREKKQTADGQEKQESRRLLFDIGEGTNSLAKAVKTGALRGGRIIAAIGSERGWTENERASFKNAGFTPWSLGKSILRTETAAVAATVLILAALEEDGDQPHTQSEES